MLDRIMAWFIMTFQTPKKTEGSPQAYDWARLGQDLVAILLFEIGNLQVYHFQTRADKRRGKAYTEVYWRDKNTLQSFGPFSSVYSAVTHYQFLEEERKAKDFKTKVISVDFRSKKKLGYYV